MASKITIRDVALFTRQLATMMKAGVPLVQSLEVVADTPGNPAMKDLTLSVRDDVAAGKTLATALREHPDQFDFLFCDLVQAGEKASALEVMLDRIATHKEKTVALGAKIKRGLSDAIVVLLVLFGVLLVMLTPWLAPWSVPAAIAVIVVFYVVYKQVHKRSEMVRNGQQRLALKLPILGDIHGASSIARITRTLSTTFAAGVPLVDALESVSGAAGNPRYYKAIRQVKEDVSGGVQLNHSMKQTDVFPDMVIRMVAIGEASGTLDVMLDKAATYYEELVDNAVDGLTSLLQPILMGILCTVIVYQALSGG